MAWTEWGDASNPQVLVCVHGVSRQGRDFDALAQAMANRYRVVCPDIVGRGRSDWLRDPAHYAVPQYVADCATLLDHLGARRVAWVGTSMGGLIGMGLAAWRPESIGALVLNDVGPVIRAQALARIGDYLGADVSFGSFDDGAAYLAMISASFGPHTPGQWRTLSRAMLVWRDQRWRLHYDPRIVDNFRQVAQVNVAQVDTVLWEVYDAVRCPTLALRGEHSDLLSRETHQAMAARGPRAQLAEIAGVGHAPTLIAPDQIARVHEWLTHAAA